jgi:hypothetical protein
MTSDSNDPFNVENEDEEFWERWSQNIYERKLVKPMKKPLTAPLDLPLSSSDMQKLKAGFRPRNLDDKCAWLVEDENGNTSIHVIRYFVHEEEYVLHIAPKSGDDDGARVDRITWEGDVNGIQRDAEQAKKNVVILARVILKCEFETLPEYERGTLR